MDRESQSPGGKSVQIFTVIKAATSEFPKKKKKPYIMGPGAFTENGYKYTNKMQGRHLVIQQKRGDNPQRKACVQNKLEGR